MPAEVALLRASASFCFTALLFHRGFLPCQSKSFVLNAARHCESVITSPERRFDARRVRESSRYLRQRLSKSPRFTKSRNRSLFVNRNPENSDRTLGLVRARRPLETDLQRHRTRDQNAPDDRFESLGIHGITSMLSAAASPRLMGRSIQHWRTRSRK